MEDFVIPNHVGIIVDGNGRWAKNRGLIRSKGHDAGLKNLKDIVKYAFEKGVNVVSVYVFSTENFKRDKDEVDHLMNLFVSFFESFVKELNKKDIKVVFSGRNEPLPSAVIRSRDKCSLLTKDNKSGILNVCLNYGGRAEIVDACKNIIRDGIDVSDINEELFGKYLYNDLPSVDLMIRTSGELRLSNFMLWQNSYAEFYFPNVTFPDFNRDEFDKSILEYNNRDRRFGGIKDK